MTDPKTAPVTAPVAPPVAPPPPAPPVVASPPPADPELGVTLYEYRSACGGVLNHPYLHMNIDESWTKPLPSDAWFDLQRGAGKLQRRLARDGE